MKWLGPEHPLRLSGGWIFAYAVTAAPFLVFGLLFLIGALRMLSFRWKAKKHAPERCEHIAMRKQCYCKFCGKPFEHDWDGCVCRRCGKDRHQWVEVGRSWTGSELIADGYGQGYGQTWRESHTEYYRCEACGKEKKEEFSELTYS
ncbi:MAG: hypothetical protein LBJ11_08600 [Oscillospiraceae bacterium]|jgi:hypothetical protein|nr:hypothetical protein [Oscillospiraceae bacterium]